MTALFPRAGDDQISPGAFKFLWGSLFGNVAKTLAFLTQDEAQTTRANIIGEGFSLRGLRPRLLLPESEPVNTPLLRGDPCQLGAYLIATFNGVRVAIFFKCRDGVANQSYIYIN